MKPRALSTKNITGKNVENLKGENIGEIEDLMIDLENGNVMYAVLSFGGFLGMGEKYFAVPMQEIVFSERNDIIKLDVDKERLENAPGFDKNKWPMHPSAEFVNSVYDYYGHKPLTSYS